MTEWLILVTLRLRTSGPSSYVFHGSNLAHQRLASKDTKPIVAALFTKSQKRWAPSIQCMSGIGLLAIAFVYIADRCRAFTPLCVCCPCGFSCDFGMHVHMSMGFTRYSFGKAVPAAKTRATTTAPLDPDNPGPHARFIFRYRTIGPYSSLYQFLGR